MAKMRKPEVKYERTQCGDISQFGMFIWQGHMYVVQSQIDDDWVQVQRIAGGWTNNPYDRWQYNAANQAERFRADCPVWELIYEPDTGE